MKGSFKLYFYFKVILVFFYLKGIGKLFVFNFMKKKIFFELIVLKYKRSRGVYVYRLN